MKSTPRRWLLGVWVLLGPALWAASAWFTLTEVRDHLEQARAAVDDLTGTDDVDLDLVVAAADEVERELAAADDAADDPVLASVRWMPVIGRQVTVVDQVAETGHAVAQPMGRLVTLAAAGPTGSSGPERLEFLDQLIVELNELDQSLTSADLGPSHHLVGQIAEARAEVADAIEDHHGDVVAGRDALVALRSLLDGGEYLLLGANNAEMRTAAGMVLSLGVVSARDGELELSTIESTGELFPVPTVPVVDSDVENLWGFLTPTNDYRKLTYSARFDEYTGPQSLAMWEGATGRSADGALLVDPFVFEAVVAATGPVELDGRLLDRETVVDYLLRGQYERYDDAFERRDQLADLAAAVFVAFQSGEVDYGSLISRLPALVRGRHLMVYSAEPTAHQAWKRLGVAGAVESGQVGIFLHNLGGSKLDPYLDVDVQVDDTVADGVRTVRLGVSVTNTVGDADALADYVAGPWEFVGVPRRGSYSGRLVVYAPGSASELRFVPERTLEAFGRDGAVALMASRFVLEPGDSSPFTVEFEIPAHVSTVEVLPSARFPAVVWRHGDRSETDQAPLLLEFE